MIPPFPAPVREDWREGRLLHIFKNLRSHIPAPAQQFFSRNSNFPETESPPNGGLKWMKIPYIIYILHVTIPACSLPVFPKLFLSVSLSHNLDRLGLDSGMGTVIHFYFICYCQFSSFDQPVHFHLPTHYKWYPHFLVFRLSK